MNYAIIENGIVANIIVGLPSGMDGICVDGLNVAIGDSYEDGAFTRGGEPVLTDAEKIAALEAQLAILRAQIE